MAKEEQRETTFGLGEMSDIYVQKSISREGVKSAQRDLADGVAEVQAMVESKIDFQENKKGRLVPEFVGNINDLKFLRGQLKEAKENLSEYALFVGEQVADSVAAFKVGIKNFGIGLLTSAGCGLLNEMFIKFSQSNFEKYGEYMDGGEGVLFLAIAGLGALGFAVNSAINAGKAGISGYRNANLLNSTEDAIADVDKVEACLDESVLNRTVEDHKRATAAEKYEIWKKGFHKSMKEIDRTF